MNNNLKRPTPFDDQLDTRQIEILRGMTPAKKWEVFYMLLDTARSTRRRVLQQEHPEWDKSQLDRAVAQWTLHAQS